MNKYILKDKKAIRCDDLSEWGAWFETADRIVAKTTLPDSKKISTVFLGLDYSFENGKPLLFETMVFPEDSYLDLDMERYSTWEEAEEGHKKMVEKYSHEM